MSITDFFRGKVLLVTGGTAFLGQPMVAKILTALPDIQKIYLLIRSRTDTTGKHTSAQERLENELLTSDVFASLRRLHGDNFDAWAQQKLTAIEGRSHSRASWIQRYGIPKTPERSPSFY